MMLPIGETGTGDHLPQGVPKVAVPESIGARAVEKGSYRTSSTHLKLLQLFVPCLQGNREVEDGNRSSRPQRLCALPNCKLHYGDASVNPREGGGGEATKGPVVNLPRLEICLPSHRDKPSRQTLPVYLSR